MNNNLFGAQAIVYLKYEGEITELAKVLNEILEIPEIYFDTETDQPHEVFGMSKVLGFELWLNKSTFNENFNFEHKIETDMDVKDRFEYQTFDLSPWLAKEITKRSEIKTFIAQVLE